MPFTQLNFAQLVRNGSRILPPKNETNCADGVAPWLYSFLGQCALDNLRYASLLLGLISLIAWTIAAFPQLYKNCKEGIPDVALSPWMLINWMLGDVLNLVGALLSNQLAFQIYVAAFYVCSDVVNLSQFAYFKLKNYYDSRRKGELLNTFPPPKGYRSEVVVSAVLLFFGFTYFSIGDNSILTPEASMLNIEVIRRPGGRTLMAGPATFIFPNLKTDIGYTLGSISSILYFASRIPQIVKNFQRKCTEGLSLFLFILALVGNGTYGVSVLLQSVDGIFIVQHFPWLMGTLGVMTLDFTIAMQFYVYKKNSKTERSLSINASPRETTPLLNNDGPLV